MKTQKSRKVSEKEVFLLVAAFMCLMAYGGWTMRASARAELDATAQALREAETSLQENEGKLANLKRIMNLTRMKGIGTVTVQEVVEKVPLLQGFTLSTEGGKGGGSGRKALYLMWMEKTDFTPKEIIEMTQFMKRTFGENQAALVQAKPPLFAVSAE